MLDNRPNFFLSDAYHTIFYNVRSHKNATTVLKQNSVYIPRIHSWISVCMLAINTSIYLWLLSERVSHWIHTGNVTICVMCMCSHVRVRARARAHTHTHTHTHTGVKPPPLSNTPTLTYRHLTDTLTSPHLRCFLLPSRKPLFVLRKYLNFSWFIRCPDRFCTVLQLLLIDARIVPFL